MDEIPGRIPNGNSIAPNKEMHELLHQQILKNTLIDRGFLNKFFQVATETLNSSKQVLVFYFSPEVHIHYVGCLTSFFCGV